MCVQMWGPSPPKKTKNRNEPLLKVKEASYETTTFENPYAGRGLQNADQNLARAMCTNVGPEGIIWQPHVWGQRA